VRSGGLAFGLALLCVVLDQLLAAHHTDITMLNWYFPTTAKMWMVFGTVDPQDKILLL